MKRIFLLVTTSVACLVGKLWAEVPSGESTPPDFQIIPVFKDGQNKIDAREDLSFELVSHHTNGLIYVFLPDDLGYYCRAELFDKDHSAVAKTEKGKTVGALFDRPRKRP